MNYTLKYLPLAKKDISEIALYISTTLGNPSAADRLVEKMFSEANKLTNMPYKYRIFLSPPICTHEYRRLVVGNYVMIYYIDEAKKLVKIARVMYAKRNIDRFLR